jgi:hypothetical protein
MKAINFTFGQMSLLFYVRQRCIQQFGHSEGYDKQEEVAGGNGLYSGEFWLSNILEPSTCAL